MSNDTRYRLISIGWLLAAFTVPPVVGWLTRTVARRSRRGSRWGDISARLATIAVWCTLTPVALAFAVCGGPPPGESDAAVELKARIAPVIAGIERFRAERGQYPASLEVLADGYVSAGAIPPARTAYPVRYERDSAGYVLSFRYAKPGMNVCEYRPTMARWYCFGYF